MSFFSPYKRRPNRFNYIPRYYDPEKEAREQRRAELRGERSDDREEYRPGKYISTQRAAREARRHRAEASSRRRVWTMAFIAVVVLLLVYVLYPRLAAFMAGPRSAPAVREAPAPARGGLDQSGIGDVEWQEQPITVVPNDYQE